MTERIPLGINGTDLDVIAEAITNAGFHLRGDRRGFYVERVPKFLLPDTNVVSLRRKKA